MMVLPHPINIHNTQLYIYLTTNYAQIKDKAKAKTKTKVKKGRSQILTELSSIHLLAHVMLGDMSTIISIHQESKYSFTLFHLSFNILLHSKGGGQFFHDIVTTIVVFVYIFVQ